MGRDQCVTELAALFPHSAPLGGSVGKCGPVPTARRFTSAIVDFPPSARAAPHRHGEAFVYAYVPEGTVRSKLDDTPASTYHQGKNWVEQPGAHHVLRENTGQTERAARVH